MAWIIENEVNGVKEYYSIRPEGGGTWTKNIDEALQFAREEDARKFDGGARHYLQLEAKAMEEGEVAFVPPGLNQGTPDDGKSYTALGAGATGNEWSMGKDLPK